MEESENLRRATEFWQAAYRYQMEGELDRAVEHYQRSIEVYPTAEAHTFLGWTLSFQGRLEEATAECLRAIEIDPYFGNPYSAYPVDSTRARVRGTWRGTSRQGPLLLGTCGANQISRTRV